MVNWDIWIQALCCQMFQTLFALYWDIQASMWSFRDWSYRVSQLHGSHLKFCHRAAGLQLPCDVAFDNCNMAFWQLWCGFWQLWCFQKDVKRLHPWLLGHSRACRANPTPTRACGGKLRGSEVIWDGVFCIWDGVSGIWYLVSGIWYLDSGYIHFKSNILIWRQTTRIGGDDYLWSGMGGVLLVSGDMVFGIWWDGIWYLVSGDMVFGIWYLFKI